MRGGRACGTAQGHRDRRRWARGRIGGRAGGDGRTGARNRDTCRSATQAHAGRAVGALGTRLGRAAGLWAVHSVHSACF